MGREDDKRINTLDLFSPEVRKRIEEATRYPPLPDWPLQVRGVPNISLRSSLFGVVQRGRRRAVKGELLASIKGISIRYTGWRLDQGDFDVLLYALHLVSLEKSTKEYARFSGKGFLRAIGRTSGKSGREWLKDSFRRLTGSAVEITFEIKDQYNKNSYTYAGSLVDEFYYSSDEGCYLLKINPKLARLFDAGWTQMPNGRLVFGIFAALADFEADFIRERTKAGLSADRARGRVGGRPRKMTKEKLRMAMAATSNPNSNATEAAKDLGLTRTSLYDYVNGDGSLKDKGQKLLYK